MRRARLSALLVLTFCLRSAVLSAVDTPLHNGAAVPASDSAVGNSKYYYIDVPAGQTSLRIVLWGGSGNADLYVDVDGMPTTSHRR